MKHRARGVILVLLVAGLLAVFAGRRGTADDQGVVRGSGTVEATELEVAAETAGRIVALRVAEGDQVVAGQVIAVLRRDTLEAELERADATAFTARMRLADVEAGARPEEVRIRAAQLRGALAALETAQETARLAQAAWQRPTEMQAAVDSAAARLAAAEAGTRQARAQREEAVHGPRTQELAEARAVVQQAEAGVEAATAALAQAEAALQGARAELSPAQRANLERAAATTQVNAAETRLGAAHMAVAQAEARLQQVTNVPRPGQREQLAERVDRARAALTLAEQQLGRERTLFEAGAIARSRLDLAVANRDQAAALLDEARAGLADLEAGAREPERQEATAVLERARIELRGAERDLANARHEQAIGQAALQQQFERAGAAVGQADERRNQAEALLAQAVRQREQASARLALLTEGTRSERLAQAAAGMQSAEASQHGAADALRHARQARVDRFQLAQQREAAEGQVRGATAAVEAARAQLDLALHGATVPQRGMARGEVQQAEAVQRLASRRLGDTVIRAPLAGTISELVLREGETVTPGAVVVRLLDLEHLWVRVFLPVTRFGLIHRQQAARVTADALPTKVYPGVVSALSEAAEFTPKNTQTVEERVKQVFWVKVDVGRGQGELKPGIPADVVFDLAVSR